MMKIIVTGSGQLAQELQQTSPQDCQLHVLPRMQMDISNASQVEQVLQEINPDIVINTAAYTAVDNAEQNSQSAYATNVTGPQNLATTCKVLGAYLIQLSTDFVFDGHAHRPYKTDDEKNPLSVYGKTKAQAEEAVSTIMQENWAIIRTAWVYSSHGHNFVKTMLRLMAEKPHVSIVVDQIGTPTWARGLAQACWAVAKAKLPGVYHWTDAGVASWYDFAVAVQRQVIARGIPHKIIRVHPITSEEYPTPATRPAYSVLDKSKIIRALPSLQYVHWQDQLEAMLNDFLQGES